MDLSRRLLVHDVLLLTPWCLLPTYGVCTLHKQCLQTGYIDYEKLEDKALDYRPKLIICGGSAYPREWDYAHLRQIAGAPPACTATCCLCAAPCVLRPVCFWWLVAMPWPAAEQGPFLLHSC